MRKKILIETYGLKNDGTTGKTGILEQQLTNHELKKLLDNYDKIGIEYKLILEKVNPEKKEKIEKKVNKKAA